ncbi:MAG: GNAT family N-acetyltransferase [Polyangiaceae bacterium]
MIIDEIDSVHGLVKLESEWRALQNEVGTLPFTSWEWNVAWWRNLSRHSLTKADRLFVRAFRSPRGELLGVAPLMITELPARGIRLRCLRYFGADPNITEIRGPLIRPSCEVEVYESLLQHVFGRAREWDCVMLDGIRADSEAVPILKRFGQPLWTTDVPDFTLTLPKTWEQFRSSRSRNIKESLRKCVNSLKRDGIEATHRVATHGPELQTAIRAFLELHAARSNRTDTVRHGNVFESTNAAGFLRELEERCASTRSFMAFSMEIAAKAVAVRLAFPVGRSLYLYYSGYDPQYGQYSVMTNVVAEAIKYAIAEGYEIVNLSTGNDVSKTRWSPDEVTFRQAVLPSGAIHARFATAGFLRLRKFWQSRMAVVPAASTPDRGTEPTGTSRGERNR